MKMSKDETQTSLKHAVECKNISCVKNVETVLFLVSYVCNFVYL